MACLNRVKVENLEEVDFCAYNKGLAFDGLSVQMIDPDEIECPRVSKIVSYMKQQKEVILRVVPEIDTFVERTVPNNRKVTQNAQYILIIARGLITSSFMRRREPESRHLQNV